MSFEACSCFLLRCDGCGTAFDDEFELHFPSPDPADHALVDQAEGCS